ncbi:MAG: hypothetical protein ACXVBK_17080 [Flavisolibacter sp.]
MVVGRPFADTIFGERAGNIQIAVYSIDRLKYLTDADTLAADFNWEGSTMSNTEIIILVVVLIFVFGGGGFYWSRRR